MPPTIKPLLETNRRGAGRQWSVNTAMCPALTQYGIFAAGIGQPGPGYCFVRLNPASSYVNVCLSGTGHYLVNGQWRDIEAGHALILPRHHRQGAEWKANRDWRIAWVRFADAGRKFPRVAESETQVVPVDPAPWEWAIRGLHHEAHGANDADCVEAWIEVLHQLVRRLVRDDPRVTRMAVVWEQVAADPSRAWAAADFAKLAGISEVHLRRLCRQALGRTPMQQLAWLRTRQAALLLQNPTQTVESAAWSVGYASVSAFTAACKRWLGQPPRGLTAG